MACSDGGEETYLFFYVCFCMLVHVYFMTQYLRSMYNFNTLMAVRCALNHSAIKRLKQTNELISPVVKTVCVTVRRKQKRWSAVEGTERWGLGGWMDVLMNDARP